MTDIAQNTQKPDNALGVPFPGRGLSIVMLIATLAAVIWIGIKASGAGYPVGAVALPAVVGACLGAALVFTLRRR